MNCRNHEGVAAEDRCAGCAEAFCSHCLVQVAGRKFCGACKVMNVKAPPQVMDGNMKCEEAGQALTYAIIGIFCFGFIFGSMAISKAVAARRAIREDPRLVGEAKANVALILGTMVLILWVLGLIGRAKRNL